MKTEEEIKQIFLDILDDCVFINIKKDKNRIFFVYNELYNIQNKMNTLLPNYQQTQPCLKTIYNDDIILDIFISKYRKYPLIQIKKSFVDRINLDKPIEELVEFFKNIFVEINPIYKNCKLFIANSFFESNIIDFKIIDFKL